MYDANEQREDEYSENFFLEGWPGERYSERSSMKPRGGCVVRRPLSENADCGFDRLIFYTDR